MPLLKKASHNRIVGFKSGLLASILQGLPFLAIVRPRAGRSMQNQLVESVEAIPEATIFTGLFNGIEIFL